MSNTPRKTKIKSSTNPVEPTLEEVYAELKQLRERVQQFESRGSLGLVWEDMPEDVEQRLANEVPVFASVPSLDIKGELPSESPHVLIEGDNLHALYTLQATHHESIDVIYIDPPYNLGGDFRYNDKIIDSENNYRHSAWLSFMDRRLRLAQPLLSETGVIIAAIDDTEYAHLKLLMDQVLGPQNFIASVVWSGGRKNDSRYISVSHDYMLIYARSEQSLKERDIRWREEKPGFEEILVAGKKAWDESGHDEAKATTLFKAWWSKVPKDSPIRASKHYNQIDGIGQPGAVYFADNISWPGGGGPTYEVLHPVTKLPVPVPSRGWIYQEPRMLEEIAAGRIQFGPDHTRGINRKSYLHVIDSQVAESTFYSDRRSSAKALTEMLGGRKFEFPKDVSVLSRWINLVSVANPNALVLDFFAGSGTTLQSVAELNAADGGNRRCILITNNENNICREVTQPRIKAALTGDWASGQHDPLPGSLTFYKTDFIKRRKGLDQMRSDIAKHTVNLVAIKEGAIKKSAKDEDLAMLYGTRKSIAVVASLWPDHVGLAVKASLAARDGDQRVAYVFTWSDQGIEEETTAIWTGWDVQPLPAEMLAALRRLAPQTTLFDETRTIKETR